MCKLGFRGQTEPISLLINDSDKRIFFSLLLQSNQNKNTSLWTVYCIIMYKLTRRITDRRIALNPRTGLGGPNAPGTWCSRMDWLLLWVLGIVVKISYFSGYLVQLSELVSAPGRVED